jgi:phage tail-like protein
MSNPAPLFPGYAFILYLKSPDGGLQPLGGFSESAGLLSKVQGVHTVGDVTLKRGVADSSSLNAWISAARAKGPSASREVIVTQRGAGSVAIRSWSLAKTTPAKYAGPTLGGKGNDVAIEELVLAVEKIEIVRPR